jgi:hypothetical protein
MNTGSAAAVLLTIAQTLIYRGTARHVFVAGGQDDHGGSGLGEFRTVNREQGEWNGGGKLLPGDPNTYDTLVAQPGEVNR